MPDTLACSARLYARVRAIAVQAHRALVVRPVHLLEQVSLRSRVQVLGQGVLEVLD